MKKYLITLIVLLNSCTIQEGTNPKPPKPEPTNPPVYQVNCQTACDNLYYLECEEGKPLVTERMCWAPEDCPEGDQCKNGHCETPCNEFCERTQRNGVLLDVACVSNITECSQLDSCDRLQ